MLEAVVAGASDPEIEGVEVLRRPAQRVAGRDAGTCWAPRSTSGYISGALKHFFDTVYYPSLDHVAGRPYGL